MASPGALVAGWVLRALPLLDFGFGATSAGDQRSAISGQRQRQTANWI
jgi:hypothetical protein